MKARATSVTLNEKLEQLSLVRKAYQSQDRPKARFLVPDSQVVNPKEKVSVCLFNFMAISAA